MLTCSSLHMSWSEFWFHYIPLKLVWVIPDPVAPMWMMDVGGVWDAWPPPWGIHLTARPCLVVPVISCLVESVQMDAWPSMMTGLGYLFDWKTLLRCASSLCWCRCCGLYLRGSSQLPSRLLDGDVNWSGCTYQCVGFLYTDVLASKYFLSTTVPRKETFPSDSSQV